MLLFVPFLRGEKLSDANRVIEEVVSVEFINETITGKEALSDL
jgi:hypothetical protein